MSRRFEQSDHPPHPEPGPETTQSVADGGSASPKLISSDLASQCRRLSQQLSEQGRRLEQLEQERDFLLRHGENLEVEIRRLSRLRGRVRDLERLLGEAEGRLRHAESSYLAVINSGTWRVLEPYRALRRILLRFRG